MSPVFNHVKRLFCPSPKVLVGALLGELSPRDERRFLDHVLVCDRCRREYAALRQIDSAGRECLQGLEGLRWGEDSEGRVRALAVRELERLGAGASPRFPAPVIRVLAASAALVLVAAAAGVFLLRREPAPTEAERRAGRDEIRLIGPSGESARDGLEFRWSGLPGADYTLEIYTKALEPLFIREGLGEPRFGLPAIDGHRLRPGEFYFWKVSARFEGGRSVVSDFVKFKIRRD